MTAPLCMRSSGSPGSWPPSGVYLRYLAQTYTRIKKLASFFRNPATLVCACAIHLSRPEPTARERTVGEVPALASVDATATQTGQSLVSVTKGDKTRTFREPKLTITASSSSTKTTRPRPYLSWVT
jgi:hypothetical protein